MNCRLMRGFEIMASLSHFDLNLALWSTPSLSTLYHATNNRAPAIQTYVVYPHLKLIATSSGHLQEWIDVAGSFTSFEEGNNLSNLNQNLEQNELPCHTQHPPGAPYFIKQFAICPAFTTHILTSPPKYKSRRHPKRRVLGYRHLRPASV